MKQKNRKGNYRFFGGSKTVNMFISAAFIHSYFFIIVPVQNNNTHLKV